MFSLLDSCTAQLHEQLSKNWPSKKRAKNFANYLQLIQGFQRQSKLWASSEVVPFKGPEK